MILIYVLLLFLLIILVFRFCEFLSLGFPKFQLNPSALYTFYGAPGSGKTTLLCHFAVRAIKSGIKVYSNVPISGCLEFDKTDLGKYLMEDCLILWDEVGVDANSRNFKANFTLDQIRFLKYHRHERAEIMVFSQGFDDADKIIRTLSTELFVVRKGFFKTVSYRRIAKRPDIDDITHKPDDIYFFAPLSKKRIFCPVLWKHFDSYSRLGLPEKENWNLYGSNDEDVSPSDAQSK